MLTLLSLSSTFEDAFQKLLTSSGRSFVDLANYLGVHPIHLVLEVIFGLAMIYFIFQKSFKIKEHPDKLTPRVSFAGPNSLCLKIISLFVSNKYCLFVNISN